MLLLTLLKRREQPSDEILRAGIVALKKDIEARANQQGAFIVAQDLAHEGEVREQQVDCGAVDKLLLVLESGDERIDN